MGVAANVRNYLQATNVSNRNLTITSLYRLRPQTYIWLQSSTISVDDALIADALSNFKWRRVL